MITVQLPNLLFHGENCVK